VAGASTTALILASLEVVAHELQKANDAIDGADRQTIAVDDLSRLKRSITLLAREADEILTWLSEERLEDPKN
jgi:hypothetical protein